jgi:hypothetical protein
MIPARYWAFATLFTLVLAYCNIDYVRADGTTTSTIKPDDTEDIWNAVESAARACEPL